jgi:hypothetical protein
VGLKPGSAFGFGYTRGFDLDADGTVTYWKPAGAGGQIWQYTGGVARPRTGVSGIFDTSPAADGSVLAFRRIDPISGTAAVIVKVGRAEQILTTWPTSLLAEWFGVRDGYLAYDVPGASGKQSLWRRAPNGAVAQVSPDDASNFIVDVGPSGRVVFAAADLMESEPGKPTRRISTAGGRPVCIDRQLHVMLGRSLFRVPPAPTPQPRVWIDLPATGSVSEPFIVAGWALDAAATAGTGVDLAQIYAMPDVGPAIFLGTAAYGGTRPDVGTAFGSHFTNSGYGLVASDLPAGHYQIAVFAHDTVLGGFAPAALRDVTVP